jgi:2-methylcitrate dehydratase PrpD
VNETQQLARLIVRSQPQDIPAAVGHEARRCILHWLGCSVAGSRQESVQCALAAVDELSGPRLATVLGRKEKLDVGHAAFINGVSADVLSFSDTHPATLIHPGGVIGSAALALAERAGAQGKPVSGVRFLHAFVIGFQVACRVGLSVYPWHYRRGWHITGTAGIFGAAAAAGMLMQLDERQMVWALGIAATQSAGLREMFGTMSKNLHIGRAAQGGLMAALLAGKNFTSSERSLEAPRGFAEVLGHAPDLAAITADFGSRHEILQNTYKPFPCGVVLHPVIEGCALLSTANRIQAGTVRRIALRCNPLVLELTGILSPATTLEAKLSVYHAAAAATVAGQGTLQEFTPEFIHHPDVLALREKVDVVVQAGMGEDEADVTIELVDGRAFHCHIEHAIGSADRPMSDRDMQDKFRGLTAALLPASQVDGLIEACGRLETLDDAAQLASLATARGTA